MTWKGVLLVVWVIGALKGIAAIAAYKGVYHQSDVACGMAIAGGEYPFEDSIINRMQREGKL